MTGSVGYRKPPKHAQFKKGKSGNPKGRPKGARNMRTIVTETLEQRVMVTEKGKRKSMSAIELLLRTVMRQALQGDSKAITQVLNLAQGYDASPDEGSKRISREDDLAIMRRAIERARRDLGKGD